MNVTDDKRLAISIRQPWASAIFLLGKDVENRSWQTPHRGRLYIHASAQPFTTSAKNFLLGLVPHEDYRRFKTQEHPKGAIIGYVVLIDCVKDHRSRWADPQQFHWILGSPVLLNRPYVIRGRLGLWRFDDAELHL